MRARRIRCKRRTDHLHQGVTGHALGAAGALGLHSGIAVYATPLVDPSPANTATVDPDFEIDLVLGHLSGVDARADHFQ